MSETSASRPSSPTPPTPTSPLPKEGENKTNKFAGDGLQFKGKLIGMEDLPIDRDEKICLESMFKLKAVVRARGEHKQRIQLNLTMSAVNIIDDITKAQIASHEIERISFVVIDPRDNRAFGYIYNTSDDRHQFWAIKTERAAALTVIALRELFESAFEQYTNAEKAKEDANKPVTTPPLSPPVTASEQTVQTQEPTSTAPVSSPPPSVSSLLQTAPVSPSASAPEPAASAIPSLLDDPLGFDFPPVTTQTGPSLIDGLDDWNTPSVPVKQSIPKVDDPLADLFNDLSTTTTAPPPLSTNSADPLADLFSTAVPPPPVASTFNSSYNQPIQTNLFNVTPSFPQQRPVASTVPLLPQQQQQPDFLNAGPTSPVAPPTVTSPFAGLDILGGLTLAAENKTTKSSFFPNTPPPKTMQQLQMEKQS